MDGSLTGSLLGLTVQVTGPAPLIAALGLTLPPGWSTSVAAPVAFWRAEEAVPGLLTLTRGPELLGTWAADVAPGLLMSDLELWVAEHTTEAVVVHAGVVAVDGRAIVLPGRSLQGKSTLTVALLEAGAGFMSDEYALLSADGQVRAYPRPISVRPRADQPAGAAVRVPVEHFGATVEPGPVAVGLVVNVRYDAAAGLALTSMGPGQTALALIDNAVAAQTQKLAVMRVCTAAAAAAQGLSGSRGEAAEAARHLMALLSRSAP